MRFVFAPVGIAAGLLAGLLAQKLFDRLWALVDDEEPPESSEGDVRLAKLVPALLLQGAVFRLTKGLVDRGARRGFAGLTGSWPGEMRAES